MKKFSSSLDLTQLPKHWAEAAAWCEGVGQDYVLVTVLDVHGSVPREAGTKMLVTEVASTATIGGGHLEFQAIQKARAMLENSAGREDALEIEDYPLGARLGQCCGGRVKLLFEAFRPAKVELLLFGAGHVARALVTILAELPVRVHWVDSREAEFPSELPANVTAWITDDPVEMLEKKSTASMVLIMTHNHRLDFELVQTLLEMDFQGHLGVIGSESKANRFRKRLQHRGFEDALITRMQCPTGSPHIRGKRPMEVAVSISADVIDFYQRQLAVREGADAGAQNSHGSVTLLRTSHHAKERS